MASDGDQSDSYVIGRMQDASIVNQVRAHYASAARSVGQSLAGSAAPCNCEDGFGTTQYSASELESLPAASQLASLGCGNPVAVADISPGEVVLDLGSGGGADLVLSARRVGPAGKVYGLDMTDETLTLARAALAEAGIGNAELLRGRIEDVPLPSGTVDVVISNCVINLSVDKPTVMGEMARVLRPGGRIGIADVVVEDGLGAGERARRGSYVGCIAGALSVSEYEQLLADAGFAEISVSFTHTVADQVHGAIVRAIKPTVDSRVQFTAHGDRDRSRSSLAAPSAAPAISVEAMRPEDWGAVTAIFAEGIATGAATFETEIPAWGNWDGAHLVGHRLVARREAQVIGWAALAPVSSRCVYAGVAEVSVYVAAGARGVGVGRRLLDALLKDAERAGIWTVQAGIFPENAPSLALHRSCGFRVVGVRERVGRLNGVWRDVVFLERRSKLVGT